MQTEFTDKPKKDGRVCLLERLQANAQLARSSKRTDPATAEFAAQLESEFGRRIAELQNQLQEQAA